uniref:Magnesium transporter n=1 Tax=Knipowitschia caucasica TaxID=637954 RepID=A0AAV2J8A3_KNICA
MRNWTELELKSSVHSPVEVEHDSNPYNLVLGLVIAVVSAILIGGSVILKKMALMRLPNDGSTRAGDGGHGYLKDWLWWGGLLTMGAGEVCNFVAYAFAPATLVTPLGALAVIISAVLASHLLGEVLNLIGKFGCLLCVLGSVLLVIHAPQEQEVTSLQEMSDKLLEPGFLVYVILVLLSAAALILVAAPRCGKTHILVYLSICSLLGAFTVSSTKGLAIALQTGIHDYKVFANPLTYILVLTLVLSILAQVNYLNKSLDVFNTQMVYPIYYVLFTSVVLCTSIILFQEWSSMSPVNVATTVGAFMVIVVGVSLLNLFRDNTMTLKQLLAQTAPPLALDLSQSAAGNPIVVPTLRPVRKEDKCGLMENMVIESLPPMRDDEGLHHQLRGRGHGSSSSAEGEGPRVFIVS